MIQNLTDSFLRNIKADGERIDYRDAKTPGLVFRVSGTAEQTAKSWSVLYRRKADGKRRRVTIGAYPDYSLADARQEASQLMAAVARGEDPAKATKRAPVAERPRTFGQLAERYLAGHAPQKKTGNEDEQMLRNDVLPSIEGEPLETIKRADISAILDDIIARGSPIRANRTFSVIRKCFNWGLEKGFIETTPILRMKPPSKENSRERVLTEKEITVFWRRITAKAPMRWQMRMLLKLALVTGQRVSEIAGATRGELHLDKAEWHIPGARAKNGVPHIVPLSPLAKALFEKAAERSTHDTLVLPSRTRRAYPKSAPAKAMEKCQDLFAFDEPATPHDLRRTLGSGLGELGFSRLIQDKVLNHITERRKISAVYDRYAYMREKREALEAWADRLSEILFTGRRKRAAIVRTRAAASPWARASR